MKSYGRRDYDPENLERVKRLRREASISEELLWEQIRGRRLGFKFRRQHPMGPYVLDFYCAEARLCVEVDGEQHAERKAADARRDAWLREIGVETIRIPSLDLFEETSLETGRWLRRVYEKCCERTGKTPEFWL